MKYFQFLVILILSVLVHFRGLTQDINTDVNQASFYYNQGKYAEAAELFAKWIPIVKEKYGENDTSNYLTLVLITGNCYYQAGLNEKAEPFLLQVLDFTNTQFGENSTQYATALNNLALVYIEWGRYKQAESMLLKAKDIDKIQLGEYHRSYARDLENLGLLYKSMGQYKNAELIMVQLIGNDKNNNIENDPKLVEHLQILANIYGLMGYYDKAVHFMIQASNFYKNNQPEYNSEYAFILNDLAILYQYKGQYEEAESFFRQSLETKKIQSGENHNSITVANLGQLYIDMGQYEKAEQLILQSVQLGKLQFGENHPNHSKSLSNLAQLYQAMGRFEQAELLMKEALSIDKAFFGELHPSIGRDLNNLAMLYLAMGCYEKAEFLNEQALGMAKNQLGVSHPQYSTYLNNMAQLFQAMGRLEQAEQMMKESLEIAKASFGEDHPSYSICLNNLAQLYIARGHIEQSEPLIEQALSIAKNQVGEFHPQYSTYLNNLAQLFQVMGRTVEAEHLMNESLEIDKASLGKDHPSFGRDLNNLAQLYKTMGYYEQALILLNDAIELFRINLRENHPIYEELISNKAELLQMMDQKEQAGSFYEQAFSILKDNLRKNSGYLSETELVQYLNLFLLKIEKYQSFNYQLALSEIQNYVFAMDIELFQKGLLLNSVIETRNRILNSGDTSLINSYQTMMAIRKQADKLYSIPIEQRYEDPAILDAKANDIEKDLKLRSKEYSRSLEEAEITWKQVQDKMNPDEVVVEFASFRYYNKQWTDSTLYCALVLRKQDTVPHMIYLFEEKQLSEAIPKPENNSDAAINNTYAVLRGTQLVPDSSSYQGKNLYNLVWKPLDSLLSGTKTVNYACSGLLNTVSLAAIPDPTGKLLCEKYALNQFSSTRNIAIETNELPITDATIYGGIQYELDTTLMITNSRQYSKPNDFALAYNSSRSSNKRGNGFEELEGTREEANAINVLFKKNKITTHNFTGAAANEESFKAMATRKSPSVIHLSTHGFYYPDTISKRKSANEFQFIGSDLNRFQYSPDPLLRSGIVLAGANRVWRGEPVPDGVEDGILTAKDVSQLNLSNTQLVVLSACQTGLGDVKGSEGVFGLQRAFKMAGVKYLMMSLWSVPDKETKEFMEKFYTHWLSGIYIRQAFQNTQQEMRLEYPKDPYKWAAFVLVE